MLYVTERCVFRLTPAGVELTEVAPGVDIERDILRLMEFRPVITGDPKLMDARIFSDAPMNLRDDMLAVPLSDRFLYTPENNTFFIDFEHLAIRGMPDIRKVRDEVEARLAPLGRRVHGIVNYDHFSIVPELLDAWSDMVKSLVDNHYLSVARYTTNGFMRMKLGEVLSQHGVAPHIFGSEAEAEADIKASGR